MSTYRSTRFRELLKKPPFVCMGAHDAVTAKLAEQAGAPAIYVSGFVASAVVAGQPDFRGSEARVARGAHHHRSRTTIAPNRNSRGDSR